MADPNVTPVVRLMHLGGLEPALFREAANAGVPFERDLMPRWKVRLVCGAVAVDHVGVVGRT
jgi:hypothetical protein